MLQTYIARVGPALQSLIGSRFFAAFSGLSFVAFLSHVVFFPTRFPPLAPLSPTLWGLAPAPAALLELPPEAQSQAREAAAHGLAYAPTVAVWAFDLLSDSVFGGDDGAAVSFLNHTALIGWSALLCLSLYLLARATVDKT